MAMISSPLPRARLLVCIALAWGVSAIWVTNAQQQPAQPGGADTFTGKSWRNETKGLGLSGRGFEAAARSDWHTHDAAQLLFVQEGRMRYQVRGQKMTEVGLHGTAYLPGGVPHWHGATPDQALSQVSITFGPGIKWMEKVGDAEYSGKSTR
jgi:quercetin dioxygenase-like cupin family protein